MCFGVQQHCGDGTRQTLQRPEHLCVLVRVARAVHDAAEVCVEGEREKDYAGVRFFKNKSRGFVTFLAEHYGRFCLAVRVQSRSAVTCRMRLRESETQLGRGITANGTKVRTTSAPLVAVHLDLLNILIRPRLKNGGIEKQETSQHLSTSETSLDQTESVCIQLRRFEAKREWCSQPQNSSFSSTFVHTQFKQLHCHNCAHVFENSLKM